MQGDQGGSNLKNSTNKKELYRERIPEIYRRPFSSISPSIVKKLPEAEERKTQSD